MISLLHYDFHGVKSVRIWSLFGPYYAAFGLNTEIYTVNNNAVRDTQCLISY